MFMLDSHQQFRNIKYSVSLNSFLLQFRLRSVTSWKQSKTPNKPDYATKTQKPGTPPKAKTIWGARIDPELKGAVSVTAVVTGVESAFLRKREKHIGPLKLW
jgi:hypothetical protein